MKAHPKICFKLKLYNLIFPNRAETSIKPTLSQDQIYGKISQDVDKIKVACAKFTENGKFLVNVARKENESEIKEPFMSSFFLEFLLTRIIKTHT